MGNKFSANYTAGISYIIYQRSTFLSVFGTKFVLAKAKIKTLNY